MDASTHRRLNGLVGVLLLVLTGGLVTVFDVRFDHFSLPLLQLGALALSGLLDITATIDLPITERFGWYQLCGLANISLGVALSLAGVEMVGAGGEGALAIGLLLGSGVIAVMGIDMLVYSGSHFYGYSLEPHQ